MVWDIAEALQRVLDLGIKPNAGHLPETATAGDVCVVVWVVR